MKSSLLLLALFQFYSTEPEVPATAPNAAYPVRVHIIIAKATGGRGDYHGFGRGDIVGADVKGFDYTFSCGEPFMNNRLPTEFYQAKWKKQDEKLELLLQPIGGNHTDHCELKVAIKAKPYGSYATAGTSLPAGTGAPAPQGNPQ